MPALFSPRVSLTLLATVALVLTLANPAAAPPGDLDTTFDGDGRVTTDFANSTNEARAVAIQTDGKIVAAGYAVVSGTLDFALARYNTNGSLDTAFDGDGRVTTDFGGGIDVALAVAIQTDGKIVAAGYAFLSGNQDFALARYNTNGSLDTTFDPVCPFPDPVPCNPGDGKVTTDFNGQADAASGVAIQGDGKIVAAGWTYGSTLFDFALTRYNPTGFLDTTFDSDGRVTTDFASNSDLARGVAIQGDGKIVAAGEAFVSGASDFAVARYNANGSLDPTLDTDGRVTTDAGGTDQAFAVAIQGDGKIVAVGRAFLSATYDFALARYNSTGSLDTAFDGDGLVTSNFAPGNHDDAFAVDLEGNGKIVVAGDSCDSMTCDFALARYNTGGSLDPTFSADGKVTTDFAGASDVAWGVAIQANGRIVAAGSAVVSGVEDFALARYTCLRVTSRPTSVPVCP